MDRSAVEAAFNAAGLSRLIKDIDFLAKEAIRLSATTIDESTLPIGASRVGGIPDLPSGVNWPEWKGLPHSFIAQVHLEDIRQYDINKQLPSKGMLWFFYDAKQETYGDNPADRGGWSVLFREDDNLSTLQRTPVPAQLPAESRFKATSISFDSEVTLSQFPQLEIPNFDWTDEEQKNYETLLSTFPNPGEHASIHNRLLGNPNTLQDDMRLECQLVSHGVKDQVNDPRVAELSQGAMDWQLLLQIDSDEHAGMNWGDAGIIYYWITQKDLQNRSFDTTWFVLQSE